MSCALLGEQFDIHGGGQDLQFPHHENEIAQAEGATGKPFARYWMHNGFVRVDNTKMSKSLGNFFLIRDVLKVFDAEVVRFFLLRSHYRSFINYSDANLKDAQAGLARLYTALKGFSGPASVDWSEPHAQRFKAAMDDDFNTSEAVAELQKLAKPGVHGGREGGRSAQGARRDPRHPATRSRCIPSGGPGPADQEIQDKIDARLAARKAKNYAEADRIRQSLEKDGVILEDGPAGHHLAPGLTRRLLQPHVVANGLYAAHQAGDFERLEHGVT
jgi:cysteinyl-tRNA synthetase